MELARALMGALFHYTRTKTTKRAFDTDYNFEEAYIHLSLSLLKSL